VFTINDFEAGDRLLIVTDQNPTDVAGILTAAGWVRSQYDNDSDGNADSTRLTGTTAIDGTTATYTIDLQGYTAALTADNFLIMSQAETTAYIENFLDGRLDGGDGTDSVGPDIL
jgi:hypothetical protein